MLKDSIMAEQFYLQRIFKKNEEMLRLLSEQEMLEGRVVELSAQIKELEDKIPLPTQEH